MLQDCWLPSLRCACNLRTHIKPLLARRALTTVTLTAGRKATSGQQSDVAVVSKAGTLMPPASGSFSARDFVDQPPASSFQRPLHVRYETAHQFRNSSAIEEVWHIPRLLRKCAPPPPLGVRAVERLNYHVAGIGPTTNIEHYQIKIRHSSRR